MANATPNNFISLSINQFIIMLKTGKIIFFLYFFCSASLNAQLNADFSVNKTSGCAPLTNIQFSDLSTPAGTITSWKWIFESNGQSVLQNPLIAYTTPGTYDITLIVSNGTTFDTVIKTDYITVFANPVADFSSDDSAGCIPLAVAFADLSIAADTNIVSWSWDFGDGAFSNLQNPSHNYSTVNTYTVVLQITDANGCQGFKSVPGYITTTTKPTADFTVSGQAISCDTPLTVSFVNSSTGNGSLTYLWYFGDDSTSSLLNPSHTYLDSGLFDVALVVTDQNGCKDSVMMIDQVIISDVVASFTMSDDTVCPGQQVIFTSTSLNGQTFNWTFGDGTGTSTASTPGYSYASAGNFIITLIATGPLGACFDTITDTINVELVTADFSVTPGFGCAVPLTVQFSENASNDTAWFWNFGDPASGPSDTSSSPNPSHTYNSPGSYNVSLTVTSSHGCTSTITLPGSVLINIIQPNFSADSLKGCIPLTTDFTSLTNPPDSIASYNWNFGDGTPNSNAQNPTHTYLTDGEYTVTLITTTVSGCSDTVVKTDYIIAGFPQNIDFSVDMSTACADTFFTFTDLTFDPALADEWQWSIGGYDSLGIPSPPPPGTPFSALQNPTYNPTDTGAMWIQLIVGYNGCYDTLLKDSFIYILGPYINITSSFDCDSPFTYTFSHSDSMGIQRWFWDFGDGSPLDSVNFNTSHTYASTGDYTITDSTLNDTNGCKMVKTINIMVRDIQADFSMDTSIGCLPLTINYDGSLSQDAVSYQWDFGDSTGIFSGGPGNSHIYGLRGIFDVTMFVFDANNCMDSIVKSIHVFKPTVFFSADTFKNCVPFLVNFTDTSISDTTIVAWDWSFGDGGVDSVQNPFYSYGTPGGKTVTLVVTDTLGCKDTLSKFNYVVPIQPFPAWTVNDLTVCFGTQSGFTNSTTYPDGVVGDLSYQWSFSDGQTDSIMNPVLTFSDTGYISVSLLATDTVLGCDSSVTLNNYLHVQAMPVAAFSSSTTFSPCYNPPDPPQIFFYNTSITDYLDSISWYFGDGTTSILQGDTVGHAYTTPDTFDVQLIVETTYGCIDTLLLPQYIIVVGPTADIEVSPDTVCVGDVVTYSMVNANNVVEFSWDFGDGSGILGTNDTITYSYNQVGFLYPKLIYSFANGACEQIAVDTIYIHQVKAGFSGDTVVCRSVPNTFTNSSLAANSFEWDFGDGSPVVNVANPPAHVFTAEGTYQVSLAISNNATGCKDTITKPITVYFSCDSAECNLVPPLVSTIPDTSIIIGEEVTLYTSTQYTTSISWTPPDSLSCSDCLEPVAQPSVTTVFIVAVKDENDCFTGYDTVEVTIINEHKVDVPTAFTPDGDGVNDTVFVRGWGIKNLISFQVYNRWGQLIFETSDIKTGWDGTYKGIPQNAETYVCVVSVEYYGETTESKKGYITLIR